MENLPLHLKKYIVDQSERKYTPIDQAVWRYILRQLKFFLKAHAHENYLSGLEQTGIDSEQIPQISDISKRLQKFGWRALPVSGFIPPAAFMELQSLSVLPIASDMRSIEHLLYTPAPDIVHEAAGHAPLLIDPDFSSYLKKYSQVAKRSIISSEDLDLYEAIRILSDIKENPSSTSESIKNAEKRLEEVGKNITHISEASELSRMNWWTAEYGLIGDIKNPKIYGAGLLSSVGESKWCLSDRVKKIPMTIDCINYSYDITEPQPQLFVTPSFSHLENILEEFSQSMAFKTGGLRGVQKALKAKTVNTLELDSGVQISGQLEYFLTNKYTGTNSSKNVETNNAYTNADKEKNLEEEIIFIKMKGPSQIANKDCEIPGHDKNYHGHGYSSPIGKIKPFNKCLSELNDPEWEQLGLEIGSDAEINYCSGYQVKGIYIGRYKNLILSFKNATVTYQGQIYFQPDWGIFDLVLGSKIVSVYAGPADRLAYGGTSDFVTAKVQAPKYTSEQLEIQKIYSDVRFLREKMVNSDSLKKGIIDNFKKIQSVAPNDWLLTVELYELSLGTLKDNEISSQLKNYLLQLSQQLKNFSQSILDGISLAELNAD